MSNTCSQYPIGTPGTAWGSQEKQQWLEQQTIQRNYQDEVLAKFAEVSSEFEKVQYGALPHNAKRYPLFAFKTRNWRVDKPAILITGGVHGYETSGVQGALCFLIEHAKEYHTHFNILLVPCVSPWGYETINRWNVDAVDPNRSFFANSHSPEATLLMQYVDSLEQTFLCHIDLHETTDTDNSEFRPALAARDGIIMHDWGIPDGFYTVANTENPQLAFQQALVESVKKVTHIAPADEQGKIIGEDILSEGVIAYDKAALYLCGGFTSANYVTTTEVYPDSPSANAQICINAQLAAIKGGLDYLVTQKL